MVKVGKIRVCVGVLLFCLATLRPVFANGNDTASLIDQVEQARTLGEENAVQAINQLEDLKTRLDKFPVIEQLEYYNVLAELYGETGQHSKSQMVSEQGLKLAPQLPTPRIVIAKIFYTLGFSFESLGELDIALEKYIAGLEVAESLEGQKEIAEGLINIGAIYYQTDRLSEAVVTINEAAAIANQLSDLELKGFINSELGILYGNLKKYDKAVAYYRASYEYYLEAGKTLQAINNIRNLGAVYINAGKYELAESSYKRLLNELKSFQSEEMLFSAHMGLASIYGQDGLNDTTKALAHLDAASQIVNSVEQHYLAMQYLLNKAILLGDMKFYDEALEAIDQGLELFYSQPTKVQPMTEAMLLVKQALIFHETGKFKQAYDAYERVYEINLLNMQNNKTEAITNLRLQYESRQADIEKSILEKQNQIDSLALENASQSANNRGYYVVALTVIALIFAALLNQLLKGQRQLLQMTRIDSLTGVLTRERFIELFNKQIKSARKKKQPLSLLLIDCDYFKKIKIGRASCRERVCMFV